MPQGGDAAAPAAVRRVHHARGDELDRLPLQHSGRGERLGVHGAALALHQRSRATELHPDQRVQLVSTAATRSPTRRAATTHYFYDEVHRLLPQTYPPARRFRLQVDARLDASSYTIDFADFEQVGAPLRAAGRLGLGDQPRRRPDAASPTRPPRSTRRSRPPGRAARCGSRAGRSGSSSHIVVNNITIRGAGMWHSTVDRRPGIGFYGNYAPNAELQRAPVGLPDLRRRAGAQRQRQVNGIGGAINNSTVDHSGSSTPRSAPGWTVRSPNLMFNRMRLRNQTADAINFHSGVTNSSVTNSHFRNTGDDGLAMWSEPRRRQRRQHLHHNTVAAADRWPTASRSTAAANNTVTDNRVIDSGLQQGGGIHVGQRFASTPLGTHRRAAQHDHPLRQPRPELAVRRGRAVVRRPRRGDDRPGQRRRHSSSSRARTRRSSSSPAPASATSSTQRRDDHGVGTFVVQEQVGGSPDVHQRARRPAWGAPQAVYNCGVGFTVIDGGGNVRRSSDTTRPAAVWPTPVFPPYLPEGSVSISPSALDVRLAGHGDDERGPGRHGHQQRRRRRPRRSRSSITGDFAQTNNCGTSLAAGASLHGQRDLHADRGGQPHGHAHDHRRRRARPRSASPARARRPGPC